MTTREEVPHVEHQAILDELAEEHDLLKKEEKRISKRLVEIGTKVKEIVTTVYGDEIRQVLRVARGKAWDRRVSGGKQGDTLDLGLLEVNLGKREYREMCCDRRTIYELNNSKFEAARRDGQITDKILATCMVSPKRTLSLQLIDAPKDDDLEGL